MRILLDECVPRGLRRSLAGHEVATVPELGWSGKKNGELMQLIAAQGFDVFLTVDQNLQFEQSLKSAAFAVVRRSASSNRLAALAPLAPQVLSALQTIRTGELVEIRA
jgi:hypothetical protein